MSRCVSRGRRRRVLDQLGYHPPADPFTGARLSLLAQDPWRVTRLPAVSILRWAGVKGAQIGVFDRSEIRQVVHLVGLGDRYYSGDCGWPCAARRVLLRA